MSRQELNSLLEKLRDIRPLKQTVANHLSKDLKKHKKSRAYLLIGLIGSVVFLVVSDLKHTGKLPFSDNAAGVIEIIFLFFSIVTFLVWLYSFIKIMDDEEFTKFQLTNPYDLTRAAELLCYTKETLLEASQFIAFKIEREEHYASILKQVPSALALFLVVTTYLYPPELLHNWIQLVVGSSSMALFLGYLLIRARTVWRYIYLKNILTLALDYQARGIALPLLYIVPNISALRRRYLKTKSLFLLMIKITRS